MSERPHAVDVPVPRDVRAEILENAEVAPGHFRLRVRAPYIATDAQPGQFVQVKVGDRHDPLLRRPMSVGGTDPGAGYVEMLYRAVGVGTGLLAERPVGATLSVLGPLGRPYRLPAEGVTFLVGGGVGMPPLHFAATHLPASHTRVVQGARSASYLLYKREFEALGIEQHVATDDGSAGARGLVTDVLRATLDRTREPVEILACGPTPMLVTVSAIAAERGIRCQVSLEERMACGFGICMGCAVRRADKAADDPAYALVCTDGPVFDATEVCPSS